MAYPVNEALGGLVVGVAPLVMGRMIWESLFGVGKDGEEREGPDLQYIILPPYEIPSLIVVSGLILQNKGTQAATNINIMIEYENKNSQIGHMTIVSDENYVLRGGGERHSFARLRMRRLSPESSLFVYFSGASAVTPKVTVTSTENS